MRLIDADELKRSLSVSEILETRESLEQVIDAQPTVDPGVDEWCPDCKEYDSQRHMCPRFNRVIRETLNEVKAAQNGVGWIPCSERMPDEETDVLVTRTFLGCKDGRYGWNAYLPPKTYVEVAQYFDGEWTALSDGYKVARSRHADPVAWMPLPEPWKGET